MGRPIHRYTTRSRWLGTTAIVAFLMLVITLWTLSGLALAAPTAVRYVDGAGGSDASDCTTAANPCATIQYAIDQSASGDEILVAEGTYAETIDIHTPLSLRGGYEAVGWTRDIAGNLTVIDAGGADAQVVNTGGGDITIEGLTLQGANHSNDNAGGVWVNPGTVIISATVIQDNAAAGMPNSGGAIWFEGEGVDLTVINSSLLNNAAGGSGGGIAGCCTNGDGNLMLENVVISDNSAAGEGGALRLSPGVTVVISGSQIISNTAAATAGGIRAEGVSITITNSSILSNTTNGGGGGISADNNSSLDLSNTSLSGNQAGGSGGGLALSQATADIAGGQIANNTATNASSASGGGLWLENANATLHSVLMQGNQVSAGDYAAGGGVDVNNSSLNVNDSVIENNVVQSTGGEALGGAANSNFSSVEMMNTVIRNNDSQGTPAVQIYQDVLTVTNTLVSDNLGPGFAGTPTQGNFTNVTFANNAGFGLGIGPLEPGDPHPPVNVTITNSILWGNGGMDYYCDASVGQVVCTLSYSDVGIGDTTGTGNVSEDPLFIDSGDGDYHLGVGSPAIDAGTAAGAPANDLEGTPREAAPDMGAYEWAGNRLFLPTILRLQ